MFHRAAILLIVSITILNIGCWDWNAPVTPIVPPDNFTDELVGCWELIESDRFFEGNLFITLDGEGIEHTAYGTTFQTDSFDFHALEFVLTENKLSFQDRTYYRNNIEPMKSPCEYFPDEGMIKLFTVDDSYALSIHTKFVPEKNLFLEQRKIWSHTCPKQNISKLIFTPA